MVTERHPKDERERKGEREGFRTFAPYIKLLSNKWKINWQHGQHG
jgi:hypothetical protein